MRAITGAIIALVTTSAAAQEMRPPQVRSVSVDWSSVSLPEPKTSKPITSIFPKIGLSPVPVLLPFNVEGLLHDLEQGGPKSTSAYLGGFSVSKVFVPGSAGYDAAFELKVDKVQALNNLQYRGTKEVQISGSSVIYELTAPTVAGDALPLPPGLRERFQGIRKSLHDGSLRYTFVRYGAPYVVSIWCKPKPANKKTELSCTEADQVISYFLNALQVVGGKAQSPKRARERRLRAIWKKLLQALPA